MRLLDIDHWREIYASLSKNRVRTALTAFGVFWGIFMLMLLLGSGNGLSNGVTSGFSGDASNAFYMWTQRTSKPYRGLPVGRSFEFRDSDIQAIRTQIPEAEFVVPVNQLGGFQSGNNVTRGTKAGGFQVRGTTRDVLRIEYMDILAGRFLNPIDERDGRKVCVIGTRAEELLFEPGEDPIGEAIKINGVYFKVVGVFGTRARGEEAVRGAELVYVPFRTAQRAFNFGDEVGWFAIAAAPDYGAVAVEERVKALMRDRHRIAPDDERAIGSWNGEEEYRKVQGLFAGIRILIWIVGVGTLAAGVIGVSNIMLIVVRERTAEFGLRRAIGATPFAITGQIVLEAVVLTALAGYLGLIGGIGIVEGVRFGLEAAGANLQMFQNPGVDLSSALKAFSILVVSGVCAGLLPAWRAVSIPPVDALRSA